MPDDRSPTPMMQRYLEVKAQHPGALLLFRMGDFYELFYEDAQIAAKVLGLTLTSRDKGSPNPTPMAGFPYHALNGYLQKLVRAGYRAAICEQVEDPKLAKGLVKREVTQVVTPGTLTDDALLDPRTSNFLVCFVPGKGNPVAQAPRLAHGEPSPVRGRVSENRCGLAWLELSTGRFWAMDVSEEHVADELARIAPAECVIPEGARSHPALITAGAMAFAERPAWCFSRDECRRKLLEQFGTHTLDGFDLDGNSPGATAAGALLDYVRDTQKSELAHITKIEPFRRGDRLLIDESTRRSLELTQTLRQGTRDGSLLAVMDETVTPMGSRLLAEWLSNPLTNVAAINRRLDAVQELTRDTSLRLALRDLLKEAYDLQRLTARVATGRATPRDLGFLAKTLSLLPKIKAKLAGRTSQRLAELEGRLELCGEVRTAIEAALVDEPPLVTTEGGVIRDGYHAQLDEWRNLARGGKEWIARYQAEEIQRTGIPNLKVGFNRVFGYYLECTAAQADKAPADYIRKQTLKNLERFITPQLKEHEDKVLRAEGQAVSLEQELFAQLRQQVAQQSPRLRENAELLAELDVLAGLAELAVTANYCRPEITDEPVLDIREGRHPVLDRLQPSGAFVPNDVRIGGRRTADSGQTEKGRERTAESGQRKRSGQRTADSGQMEQSGMPTADGHALDESSGSPLSAVRCPPSSGSPPPAFGRVQLITGPNMAGKSTYIRQAALLTIMAQMGSFVPAREARIGIADRVFARVGASDELGRGQSTFMVEMTETARILNAATARSLVILDEIGRGTSTYDGISLAWAITEYLHDVTGCRTLFATHYHELTELTQTLPHAVNWNVAVREQGNDVVFLHKIVPGAADKSYGIHVAQLAGVPAEVLDRAQVILRQLEADHTDDAGRTKIPARPPRGKAPKQLALFDPPPHPVVDELRQIKVEELTPLAALQELHRLQQKAQGEPGASATGV